MTWQAVQKICQGLKYVGFERMIFIENNNILFQWWKMQLIEIPKFAILRGEKAIETLYGFIDELEEQTGQTLTDKQTDALIKLARGLISSIETEMLSNSPNEERRFMNQLKQRIMKRISESARVLKARRLAFFYRKVDVSR